MPSLDNDLDTLRQRLIQSKPPKFGHDCKALYAFDETYTELNNGSFGSCPSYVLEVFKRYVEEAEKRPDHWFRSEYKRYLNQSRRLVADLVKCQVEDLVLLNNATTGINAVLRGMQPYWSSIGGTEAILLFDTIYGACKKTAQYIIDSNPNLDIRLISIALSYPLKHDDILEQVEQAITHAKKEGMTIRIAIVDAISSLPGVIVPWEQIVKLLKRHNILSLVDGAHAVGQIDLHLQQADADFFISNCHKWLGAHRGCAFLHVPKRNQHLVPGLPTSHYYVSQLESASEVPLIATDAPSNYVAVWESLGTLDVSSFVSLHAALEFRQWLGGEGAIRQYTTNLAHSGGQLLSRRLGNGSIVMENTEDDDTLTASMVNVSIPLDWTKIDKKVYPSKAHSAYKLQTTLSSTLETFVPFYVHNNKIWIRVSAQIWLQVEDFEWLALKILDSISSLGWGI